MRAMSVQAGAPKSGRLGFKVAGRVGNVFPLLLHRSAAGSGRWKWRLGPLVVVVDREADNEHRMNAISKSLISLIIT